MEEILVNLVNSYGYLGVALLIFIENVFPPIPSEVILLFSGFLTTSTNMKEIFVIISATIGSLLGAGALYALGYYLGKDNIKKFFSSKIGSLLHFNPEHVDRANNWFIRYDKKAVFFCRFVPIVRSLISIPAGISKMKLSQFFTLTFIGSFIWNTVIISLGALTGDAWENNIIYIKLYSDVVIILFVILIICYIIYRKFKNKKDN